MKVNVRPKINKIIQIANIINIAILTFPISENTISNISENAHAAVANANETILE